MLQIVRGRTWELVQTLLDTIEGPESDMSHIVEVRSQIRTKGNNELISTLDTNLDGAVVTISLTRSGTDAIPVGDYVIDILGIDAEGNDESIMDPEAVKVVNRPTSVTDGSIIDDDIPLAPEFVDDFNEALND